ncbi:MAG TPA: hypothetical protein VF322_00730 [Gammaproteobacteria bacterium]
MSTGRFWPGSSFPGSNFSRAARLARGGQARAACLLILAASLAGCSSSEVLVAHSVPLVAATSDIPETELLDVAVNVFDPGVPEGEIPKEVVEELIREGTFVQIRRTEALYMAVLLRDTLQNSGHWGAVWVTPESTTAADLNVTAEIKHSDGDLLRLDVHAVDATGRVWLDDEYEMHTAAGAFNRQRYPELDPYQDVFNRIANDLAAFRGQLTAEQREEIRTVAGLRYAAELSPEAFDGYVVEEKDGTYVLNRLPAKDDPMFDRTQRVRQRERLFVETLDQHYAKFYNDAQDSYDGWREYAREEAIQLRELTKSARWRTGIGVATILTSIVYGSSNNDSFSDRVIRDALMYVGMDMLRTSAVRRQEKRLHTETLEELSASFDEEVEPLVVEIQGTERRLTGTVEAQYQEWRDLLRELFMAETGFVPEDLSIYTEPEPEPEPLLETIAVPDAGAPGGDQPAPATQDEGTEAAAPAEAPAGSDAEAASDEEGAPEGAAPRAEAVSDAGGSADSGA